MDGEREQTSGSFCLVIRQEGAPDNGLILRGNSVKHVLQKAMQHVEWDALGPVKNRRRRRQYHQRKEKPINDFIRENYERMSKAELAAAVSREFERTFTKNQVIGRARRMGLCKAKLV